MAVFLGCLFVGIDWGLAFGVGLAVVVQLGHITFPRLQVLGRIPGTTTYRWGNKLYHFGRATFCHQGATAYRHGLTHLYLLVCTRQF